MGQAYYWLCRHPIRAEGGSSSIRRCSLDEENSTIAEHCNRWRIGRRDGVGGTTSGRKIEAVALRAIPQQSDV
ncbi:hypothetical protein D3C77_265870 [compost metagenome]